MESVHNESSLTQTRISPAILLRTAAYYGTLVLVGLIASVLGPSLPALAENTGTQVGLMGSLFLVRSLGGLISSSQGGRLYDRLKGHRVLAAVLLGLSLILFLIPSARILVILWMLVFLWGVGESLLDVGTNTLLVWTHHQRVAPFLNGLHFSFGVGALLAPLLVSYATAQKLGLPLVYGLLAALMIPLAIWVFSLPSPVHLRAEESPHGETRPSLPFFLIALLFFLYVGAEVAFGGWVYTYAITLKLGDPVSAGYINSAFWGMLTVGRLLAVPVSLKLPPARIILIALSGCLVSMALLLFGSSSATALWAGALGLGFFMAPVFPTLLALAGKRMTITGKLTGWFFMAANAGGMTLPWLAGLVFDSAGPYAIMLLIAANLMMAMLTFAVLMLAANPSTPAPAKPVA